MDADGTGVKKLTDDPGEDLGPDWSPVHGATQSPGVTSSQ
jgi:hypothetical protein